MKPYKGQKTYMVNLTKFLDMLVALKQAFPVQPTVNAEAGLPIATYC